MIQIDSVESLNDVDQESLTYCAQEIISSDKLGSIRQKDFEFEHELDLDLLVKDYLTYSLSVLLTTVVSCGFCNFLVFRKKYSGVVFLIIQSILIIIFCAI